MNPILKAVVQEIDDAIGALQDARRVLLNHNRELPIDATVVPIPRAAERALRSAPTGSRVHSEETKRLIGLASKRRWAARKRQASAKAGSRTAAKTR